jgi:hypothetical protein
LQEREFLVQQKINIEDNFEGEKTMPKDIRLCSHNKEAYQKIMRASKNHVANMIRKIFY